MQNVRVRFAPSPTGALHIGGVRTALYNYLFAKKHKGTFILRIEDTDRTRLVEGAEEYIINALNWLGLNPDESPIQEEEYAPYRQSDRKDLYQQYVQKLLDTGNAYYAFDTEEELQTIRDNYEKEKKTFAYNAIVRGKMNNSLNLSVEETQAKIDSGTPYVVRVKINPKEEIRFKDQVRDWVVVHGSTLDDKVLLKADGFPTYHMANVVDDYLMKISHVIRGEEWLPSTPLHILLYQYLGWEKEMPEFAHLPLILSPTGGKLSKRHGQKYGFPVFPLNWSEKNEKGEVVEMLGFKETGYLSDALLNFLAFLGWNSGTEQEIFSIEELIEAFFLEKINKAGAKFDIEKAKWFNQEYIKNKTPEDLSKYLIPFLEEHEIDLSKEKVYKICEFLQPRVTFHTDFWKQGQYFFFAPKTYDAKTVKKKWTTEAQSFVKNFASSIDNMVGDWTAENIKTTIESIINEKGLKFGKVMPALRLAITGEGGGPDLMSILEIVGKENIKARIQKAFEEIQ